MQGWCNMSREELEENSPSRRDGISLKKETYLRKSYCTFLKVLGIRLQVPQITIATASIMCHRFFLIQSHSKNDRMTVATACMFLAGKSTENPRSLRDVVIVSYAIIHNKDKTAAQRIKQRELYQQQKVLILLGERLVLVTLAFDLKVDLPYIPLARLIMKYNLKEVDSFPQVSWSFVNDGLWSLLCLQFKPHQIALGAFCLAAEHLKVKLPSDGEKLWWEDHDITGRQLEEIKSQILELYSKMKVAVVVPSSQRSEITQSDSSGHHQVVSSSSLSFHKEEPGLSDLYMARAKYREGVDHHGKGDKAAAGPEKEAPQPEEGQLLEEGDDIEPPWKGKKQLDSSSSFARSGGFIRMVGRKRSRDESAQNDGRY